MLTITRAVKSEWSKASGALVRGNAGGKDSQSTKARVLLRLNTIPWLDLGYICTLEVNNSDNEPLHSCAVVDKRLLYTTM